MTNAIIAINAGSTSLKFAAYAVDASGSPPLLCRGQIDGCRTTRISSRRTRQASVGRA